MYDIDRKSCTACRKVGALHCSDPINCGQMKDESDNWMSWLDDLPVHAAFDEGIGCLQEYISALRAKLDAAEADKRHAVEAERERCAVVAETVTERQHIAHDISSGEFPRRSDMRDFIAAAIRTAPACTRSHDETGGSP